MKTTVEWIDSNEALPPKEHSVLVAFDKDEVEVCYYLPPRGGYVYGWYPGGMDIVGTFWAELPNSPFSEEDEE